MSNQPESNSALPTGWQDAWISAWHFAAEVHNQQRYPGTEHPYLKHLGMVAMEVLSAHATAAIDDLALAVQCAILHDSIEDQAVSHADLQLRFGVAVADGVAALSKAPHLSKDEAMADSLARIRLQPPAVWCVKLADRISNLQPPPAYWSAEKIANYRSEAQRILDVLGAANTALATRLATKIAAYPPPR